MKHNLEEKLNNLKGVLTSRRAQRLMAIALTCSMIFSTAGETLNYSAVSETPVNIITEPAPKVDAVAPSATEGATPPTTDGATPPATDGATPPTTDGATPPTTDGTTPPATDGATPPTTDGTTPSATEGATPPTTDGATPPATDGATPPAIDETVSSVNAAVAAVAALAAKLPATVPAQPQYTPSANAEVFNAASTAWKQDIELHKGDIDAANAAYLKLTTAEKAELGADLCAKIEAWAAALATKPVLVANKAAAPKSLTNVWVQQGATGDGSSPDRATASLLDAYNKVAENGTIHVIGTVPVNSADVIAGLNKTVTIQSATGATGVLKRNSGNAETLITIAANGNLTIKNVAIDGGAMYNGGVVSRAGAITPPCGVYTQTSGKGQLIWVLPNGSFTLGDKGVLCNNAIVGASYTIGNAFHFGSAIYIYRRQCYHRAGL